MTRQPEEKLREALGRICAVHEAWQPIVSCPTDGEARWLLLPDGSEVLGAFIHPPGRWRVWLGDEPTATTQYAIAGAVAGVLRGKMRVYVNLPDGAYPTHWRPQQASMGGSALKSGQVTEDDLRTKLIDLIDYNFNSLTVTEDLGIEIVDLFLSHLRAQRSEP